MTEDMLLKEVDRAARGGRARRKLRVRSLGWSILVVAIADYQRGKESLHRDAELFLYPKTLDGQDQFYWAVSEATGLDGGWMREVLDRRRWQWKRERGERRQRRAARRVLAS